MNKEICMKKFLFCLLGILCLGNFAVAQIDIESVDGTWYQKSDIEDCSVQWNIYHERIVTGDYVSLSLDKIGKYNCFRVSVNSSTATLSARWKDSEGNLLENQTLVNGRWYLNTKQDRVEFRVNTAIIQNITANILLREELLSGAILMDGTGTAYSASNPMPISSSSGINSNQINRVVTPSVGTSASNPAYIAEIKVLRVTYPTINESALGSFALTAATAMQTSNALWKGYDEWINNGSATVYISTSITPNAGGSTGGIPIASKASRVFGYNDGTNRYRMMSTASANMSHYIKSSQVK